ncbi:MAG: hypothetical protein AAGJ10_12345 [Bacteroidota bacterium]
MRRCCILLALLPLLTSCDSTELDPFTNEEGYFTLWGFLDPEARFQFLRVVPVGRTAEVIESPDDPNAALDAQVTLINLDTGREQQWTPTLRANNDSTAFFHVFTARTEAIRQGERYRIEVERSDGRLSAAETVIPPFEDTAPVALAPPTGERRQVYQQITLPGIEQPAALSMLYYIQLGPREEVFEIPYSRDGEGPPAREGPLPAGPGQAVNGDWVFTANYSTDAQTVFIELATRFGSPDVIPLTRIGVRIKRPGEGWQLIDDLENPGPVAQPGEQSNVEAGYGFFGSVAPYEATWEVPRSLGERIGYIYE